MARLWGFKSHFLPFVYRAIDKLGRASHIFSKELSNIQRDQNGVEKQKARAGPPFTSSTSRGACPVE